MKIVAFIKSLLPDIERKRVVESLQSIREELSEITIPLYEQTSKTFINNRFSSKDVKDFNSFMQTNVPTFRTNHIVTILKSLRNASETIESLVAVFNNHKGEKIYKDGMTLLMANQLQYSQLSSFVAGYSRRWLLHLYSLESVSNGASDEFKQTNEYQRELEYLNKNKVNFSSGIIVLSKSHKEVEKVFKTIPDVVIDSDSPVDPSITMGGSKVDPLQFGIVPTYFHFIYQIRMAYTNWQLKRHTLMVEEKRQLELKMLMLKQIKDHENDPKLEKQIDYGENRIEKLRYEINRMEEAVND